MTKEPTGQKVKESFLYTKLNSVLDNLDTISDDPDTPLLKINTKDADVQAIGTFTSIFIVMRDRVRERGYGDKVAVWNSNDYTIIVSRRVPGKETLKDHLERWAKCAGNDSET